MIAKFYVTLFVTIFLFSSCVKNQDTLIHNCFDSYKLAVLESNGKQAVDFVSQGTISHYNNYLIWGKLYNKEQLNKLSFINRYEVLIFKQILSKKDFLNFDGKKLFSFAVEKKIINKDSIENCSIENIKIKSDRAVADVLINNQKVRMKYHFVKENGKWTFDIKKLLSDSNHLLINAAKNKKLKENEFIIWMIENISGIKAKENIWNPYSRE